MYITPPFTGRPIINLNEETTLMLVYKKHQKTSYESFFDFVSH